MARLHGSRRRREKELIDFRGYHEAEEESDAVAVQPEVRGEANRGTAGYIRGYDRIQVVRRIGDAEAVALSEAAVHFRAEGEILAAKLARLGLAANPSGRLAPRA